MQNILHDPAGYPEKCMHNELCGKNIPNHEGLDKTFLHG